MDIKSYFREVEQIASSMPISPIEEMAKLLYPLRGTSRALYLLGLGGSAANASHACNDFRKLCNIRAFCPSDNVAELTARANDEGFDTIYSGSLAFYLLPGDIVMVLSVGGGTAKVSQPLVKAIKLAKSMDIPVMGIVGKQDGYLQKYGFPVVVIPQVNGSRITPHAEEFQSVILHCLVTALQVKKTVW